MFSLALVNGSRVCTDLITLIILVLESFNYFEIN